MVGSHSNEGLKQLFTSSTYLFNKAPCSIFTCFFMVVMPLDLWYGVKKTIRSRRRPTWPSPYQDFLFVLNSDVACVRAKARCEMIQTKQALRSRTTFHNQPTKLGYSSPSFLYKELIHKSHNFLVFEAPLFMKSHNSLVFEAPLFMCGEL